MVGNVIVETDKAGVTFMEPGPILKNPGEPMPKIYAPAPRARPSSPCENLPVNHNWMLGWKNGAAAALTLGAEAGFKPSTAVVALKAGQAVEINFQVSQFSDKDAVSQVLECLVGSEPYSGWALLFSSQGALKHGNLLIDGDYSSEPLKTGAYLRGASNRLRVERCANGKLHALINGSDLGQELDCADEAALISFRAQGLQAELKSATAPEAEAPQGLPPAPNQDFSF